MLIKGFFNKFFHLFTLQYWVKIKDIVDYNPKRRPKYSFISNNKKTEDVENTSPFFSVSEVRKPTSLVQI